MHQRDTKARVGALRCEAGPTGQRVGFAVTLAVTPGPDIGPWKARPGAGPLAGPGKERAPVAISGPNFPFNSTKPAKLDQ